MNVAPVHSFRQQSKTIRLPIHSGSWIGSGTVTARNDNRKESMDEAFAIALEQFHGNLNRDPDWDVTQVIFGHTTFAVTCEIIEGSL